MVALLRCSVRPCAGWLLPYFSTVLAVIAALGDVGGAYVLPLLFSLRLVGDRMWAVERRAVQWLLLPLTSVLAMCGLWSSLSALFSQAQHP